MYLTKKNVNKKLQIYENIKNKFIMNEWNDTL